MSVRGMESLGWVQRVMAASKYGAKRYKCVRLLRVPNEIDWERFFNLRRNSTDPLQTDRGGERDAERIDDDGYIPDDSAEVRLDHTSTLELETPEEEQPPFPAWTADQPMLNFLYDMIQASGTDGASTMVCKLKRYHFPTNPEWQRRISRVMPLEDSTIGL